MTLHLSRDFHNYSANNTLIDAGGLLFYTLSIFCRSIMGYTVVGQTNLPIDTPGAGWLVDEGTLASINKGVLSEYAVEIPAGQYTVSYDDIDRTIALKSPLYPRHNSGLFHIVNVDIPNNRVIIDYRSPDNPPVESSIPWAIYENEESITFLNGDNGAGSDEYETQGASADATRIIFQSPNSWQVRICKEGSTDYQKFTTRISVTVGSGGDSLGDFQHFGKHTHISQFYNNISTAHKHFIVGLTNTTAGTATRTYVWGDTETDTIMIASRGSHQLMNIFGMTENESQPVPSEIEKRLFVFGTVDSDKITVYTGAGEFSGATFGESNKPESCALATYAFLDMSQTEYFQNQAPHLRLIAKNSGFSNKTELIPADVIGGSWMNYTEAGTQATTSPIAPRRLGSCPIIKIGRENIGDFQITNDVSSSWMHLSYGVYTPWAGPRILP